MNRLLNIYSYFAFGILYLPILIVVVFSFNSNRINVKWSGFTLEWYERLLSNEQLLQAFKNSLIVATTSSLTGTIMGLLASYGLYKSVRKSKLLESLFQLPILTPDIIMGISLLSIFTILNIGTGITTVFVAHVTFNMAFASIIIGSHLGSDLRELEAAAADLGSHRLNTLLRIVIPTILPGILASLFICFLLSWDDFVISFFTSGVGSTTYPVKVYSMIKFGVDPQVNAISTIAILVSLVLLATVKLAGNTDTLIRNFTNKEV